MILIDTDVLIEIFDKHSIQGEIAFKKLMSAGETVAITSLTLHEMSYGLLKFGKKSVPGLEKLEIIPFTKEDAVLSANLEVEYEKNGLSRIDSMIAAIAINRKAKLYTYNQRHFKPIKRLQQI
ncbi:MAG: type II toxin-antitoxin system VapC family toxin [Candidatus Thermoplasmatota archaeon]|jgi:predicted nucleic acid-binding protein|nr:type II toxin-antitoxin system VapC family toxin [Candidatus Thermoplasmatota archaeon]